MFVSIPKALREKIGEEAAESLIELMNTSSQNSQNNVITLAEEKFERRLAEELAKVRSEVSEVKTGLRSEIFSLKSDLEKRISEVKEESHKNQTATIRWMFLFWVGQIGAMLGILFAFFR
jgi:hypothetical protein